MRRLLSSAASVEGPATTTRKRCCRSSTSAGWRTTSAYNPSVARNMTAKSVVCGGLTYLRWMSWAARRMARARASVARAIRLAAQDIHRKYVKPPHTTDFAVMFLATEGLYAEVVRQPALVDDLQQRYRVVVAGPSTLAALLSSLRMG